MKPAKLQNLQKFFTKKNISLRTDEGKIDLPLVAWDSISICDGRTCPIQATKNRCPYFRRIALKIAKTNQEQRCLVQAKYLRLVFQNLITAHTRKNLKQMDEAMMTNIGLLLLPLYGHLIKFKLIEAGLSLNDVMRPNGSIHGIYPGIRQTIQAIKETAKDVLPQNLQKFAMSAIDVNGTLNNIQGESDYHDKLERSAERSYKRGQMELQK